MESLSLRVLSTAFPSVQDVSELMESVSVIQVSFQAFFIRYFVVQALNSVKIKSFLN